jgi:hypothetical protein
MAGPFVAPAFSGSPVANIAAAYNDKEYEDARCAAKVEFNANLFFETNSASLHTAHTGFARAARAENDLGAHRGPVEALFKNRR